MAERCFCSKYLFFQPGREARCPLYYTRLIHNYSFLNCMRHRCAQVRTAISLHTIAKPFASYLPSFCTLYCCVCSLERRAACEPAPLVPHHDQLNQVLELICRGCWYTVNKGCRCASIYARVRFPKQLFIRYSSTGVFFRHERGMFSAICQPSGIRYHV